jgi:hypothetical protein
MQGADARACACSPAAGNPTPTRARAWAGVSRSRGSCPTHPRIRGRRRASEGRLPGRRPSPWRAAQRSAATIADDVRAPQPCAWAPLGHQMTAAGLRVYARACHVCPCACPPLAWEAHPTRNWGGGARANVWLPPPAAAALSPSPSLGVPALLRQADAAGRGRGPWALAGPARVGDMSAALFGAAARRPPRLGRPRAGDPARAAQPLPPGAPVHVPAHAARRH